MSPEEAKKHIVERIAVTRQRVTIAKAFILSHFDSNASTLINRFMDSVDAKMPAKINLNRALDPTADLKATAEAISWKLVACEAIWGLISSGAIFPAANTLYGDIGSMEWTTVVQGSGQSGGLPLDELSIRVPGSLSMPRSSGVGSNQPLTDPDLYLKELNLPDCSSEIEVALREAVSCLKHDLYLGCLAMLGRASEVAWIETGLALATAASGGLSTRAERMTEQLQDPFLGIGKKIQLVVDMYSKQDIFADLSKTSGVRLQDLKNSVVWADCVRESRNSIHYGARPAMSNSYEKVVALLIGAVPHIRQLVTLTRVANAKGGRLGS